MMCNILVVGESASNFLSEMSKSFVNNTIEEVALNSLYYFYIRNINEKFLIALQTAASFITI